jgi:hypothetical protein
VDNVAKKNGNLLTLLKAEVDCNYISTSVDTPQKNPMRLYHKSQRVNAVGKIDNR